MKSEPSIEANNESDDAKRLPELIQQISQGGASTSSSTAQKSAKSRKHDGGCLCLSCICNRRSKKKSNKPENIEMSERVEPASTMVTDFSANSLAQTNVRSHQSIKSNYMSEADIANLKSAYVSGAIRFRNTNNMIQNYEPSRYLKFKFIQQSAGSQTTNDPKAFGKLCDQLRNIPKFMTTVWGLKSPQIIIPIITGISNFKNWKNQKLEEQFRRGIIKAANKTEMWFVTNGINGGISEMVGDAFNIERISRAAARVENAIINSNGLNYSNSSELHLKSLTLIGLIPTSILQNASSFDGATAVLNIDGNKTSGTVATGAKTYRFDVNPDHTHFIIYDDETLQQSAKKPVDLTASINNLTNDDGCWRYEEFRCRLEYLFTRSLTHYRRKNVAEEEDEYETSKSKPENRQVPMVCLMIRGDLKNINEIESKVSKEIPVIVFKGSGGAADIISFAFEEITENKDPGYEDNFIKPELYKKLLDEFKDELDTSSNHLRYHYRDRILSIVKNASKGTQKFLTLVDMKGLTFDFMDLDKYILTALLQSQTQQSGKQGKAQLERNLRLTVDWNCQALALSEIFQRDDYTQIEIKHNIFDNAILRTDREEFIDLFLDQGFSIHRYLSRNNIRDLFLRAENREFFVTVILQRILGHFTSDLPENFLPDGLNEVLKELTQIDQMINILEIYMNQLGFYVNDAKIAEKKALNFLIIFAVIFNRHKLAKTLWKRTEDPLPVALVCSIIYKNLVQFCQESYLKTQIEKNQNDFALAAIGVLDASFQDNDPRSYSVLTDKHPDWNNFTVLELAYNAKNLDFIAHPCCQKILTKRLFGAIQVREGDNSSLDFPAWIKVTLSALLIFPMYYWIVFPITEKKMPKNGKGKKHDDDEADAEAGDQELQHLLDDEERDEEEIDVEETKAELNKKLKTEMRKRRRRSIVGGSISSEAKGRSKSLGHRRGGHDDDSDEAEDDDRQYRKYETPPFWRKIFLVWNAPYTKFWANFISYIFFLMLFGLVTLWPCCGNLNLDTVLWLWTATIVVEDTRIAYQNYLTGSQLPLKASIIEIVVMIVFLVLFFFVRILGSWDNLDILGLDKIFLSKAVLCVFLLYFFYRTLFIYLPISHQLGPMLVRMKLMVKNDFMTYMRLFLIFMAASGIALNSILYPYYPVNYELIKRVLLFRGFMQLFAADKVDLERTTDDCKHSGFSHTIHPKPYQCINLTDGIDFSYKRERLESFGVSYKCNYMSLMAWFILIQYFLLVKLFLPSLLTAMFSATGQRVNAQSEQLWMYQRYEIVLSYEKRLIFPPPFTLIVYTVMLINWAVRSVIGLCRKCGVCTRKLCLTHRQQNLTRQKEREAAILIEKANGADIEGVHATFNYWRDMAKKYSEDAEKETKEKQKQKMVETSVNKVREDLSSQKKSMQRLNDRVISLEKSMIQNQSYLEQIKNLLTQKITKSAGGLIDRKKLNYIHMLSRESPYVSTNIPRFFVYEKLVPWDCPYDLYDPPTIVLAAEAFKCDRILIDEDLVNQKQEVVTTLPPTTTQLGPPPPPPLPPTINTINPTPTPTAPTTPSHAPPLFSAESPTSSSSPGPTQGTNTAPSSPALPKSDARASDLQADSMGTLRTRKSSQQSLQNTAKPNIYLWNSVVQIDNPNQPGKKITIDRKSWITRVDEQTSQVFPVTYSLNSLGFPRNPMGRTGVQGRGVLHRYGPNHEIMAIVTRWKKSKQSKPIYVERKKLLEFIAVKDPLTGLTNIPGEKILGDESQYSLVCRTFMELVFEDSDVERGVNFTEKDMTSFFCSFASTAPLSIKGSSKDEQINEVFNDLGFVPTMIYRGYIDSPKNTDNAWVEAEIWNFHYDKEDFFDAKIQNPESKWREVSSNVRINSNEIIFDALKEIAELHNGFFS